MPYWNLCGRQAIPMLVPILKIKYWLETAVVVQVRDEEGAEKAMDRNGSI